MRRRACAWRLLPGVAHGRSCLPPLPAKTPPMTDLLPLPNGFQIGHWTDAHARTGCTVVLPPRGTRGGVDVRGGATGTRELEVLSPLANAEGPTAVLLTGGSAFGLAAADGVARWLEERGLGQPTPAGVVPLVPAAVVFDLAEEWLARVPGRMRAAPPVRRPRRGCPRARARRSGGRRCRRQAARARPGHSWRSGLCSDGACQRRDGRSDRGGRCVRGRDRAGRRVARRPARRQR